MLNRIHATAATLFAVMVVIQVFLAGRAMANLGGSGDFASHVDFGYTWVGLSAAAVVVTALVARRPVRDIGISAAIPVLYIVQTMLPAARVSMPWVAALHPVNALLPFGLAIWYGMRTWRTAN